MFFHQRFVPGLAIASYIVGDEKTKRAAVIDPTRDVAYLTGTLTGGGQIVGLTMDLPRMVVTSTLVRAAQSGPLRPISPDGASIADVFSTANKPWEVYVGKTQVTTSPAPDFANYKWIDPQIVTYRASDGVDVPARLYVPSNWNGASASIGNEPASGSGPAKAAAPHPAVIFVHGAGYTQNVAKEWTGYFREYMFAHFLMEHGYVVLDPDYRASSERSSLGQ